MSFETFPLASSDKALLHNKIQSDTLPQTLLLEGGDEAIRHALAKEIAAALVCVGEGEKPCGVCRACVKSKADSHPDVKSYAPPKKNATFKVETSREIRKDAFLVPNDGHNKVYILEDSQNMNDSSENALLKILEEPPQGVYFVLTCDSASAMLPTILSRAMLLRLTDETAQNFTEETVSIAEKIAASLAAGSELQTLTATAELEKDREQTKEVITALKEIFSSALTLRCGAAAKASETVTLLSHRLTEQKLFALLNTAEELEASANRNANVNLLLTSLVYKLRQCIEN